MPGYRDYDVDALATTGLQPALQLQFVKYGQYQLGRFQHAFPRQPGIRIKVQGDAVGLIQIGTARPPAVELDSPHLHRTDQSTDSVHLHVGLMVGVQFGVQMPDVRYRQLLSVLLKNCWPPTPSGARNRDTGRPLR